MGTNGTHLRMAERTMIELGLEQGCVAAAKYDQSRVAATV